MDSFACGFETRCFAPQTDEATGVSFRLMESRKRFLCFAYACSFFVIVSSFIRTYTLRSRCRQSRDACHAVRIVMLHRIILCSKCIAHQEIPDVHMPDPVPAQIYFIHRHNVFRVVILNTAVHAEFTLNRFFRSKKIGNLNI